MINITTFDLQEYIDHYNCGYYVESGATEDSIGWALRFPFIRVYSLDKDSEVVKGMRERYHFNQRLQIFHRAHDTAFYELARIVPYEYSAIIWLSDDFFKTNLEQLARSRPAKKDVLIIDNKYVSMANILIVNTYFGLTHKIECGVVGKAGTALILVPINRRRNE